MKEEILDHIDTRRPLMPLDAGNLEGSAREWFFDTHVPLYDEYKSNSQLIIGRRGSGKTAFIESAYFENSSDFVISINKATALGQIVVSLQDIPEGGRYPEAVSQLWDSVIMTMVLQSATRDISDLKVGRDYLAKIGATETSTLDSIAWTLLNTLKTSQKGKAVGAIAELISYLHSVSFGDAKNELYSLLISKKSKIIVLLDSLESEGYILEDPDMLAALKGLLKWIGDTGTSRIPIEPRASIPGEYYSEFKRISSNPLKDFARSSVLAWSARDLIVIAAKRINKYLDIIGSPQAIQDEALKEPSNCLEFIGEILVPEDKEPEKIIFDLLRHTQLIPRQFFILLNRFNERAVQDGKSVIAEEIFAAHNHRHPHAKTICMRVIADLPQVFEFGSLHKAYNRHGKAMYNELEDFVSMFLEIGILGWALDIESISVQGRKNFMLADLKGRYVDAEFHVIYDGLRFPATQDILCVHPVIYSVMHPVKSSIVRPIYKK